MSQRPSSPGLGANLLLLSGALLVTGLFLSLVEVSLRLAGIGAPTTARARLEYQQLYPPTLVPAARADGVAVLATRDPRLPYQAIRREKAPGSLRIFAFGGSATAGLGYSPNVTFARHLERMLRRAQPDREVEVVNLGIVALASKQVKVLVEEACRRYEPDLVVVYSGNNEFLEIHGERWARANTAWPERIRERVMDTNLSRVIRRAVRGAPKPPSLADLDLSRDELRRTQQQIIADVEMTPEDIEAVVDAYAANVDEMARIAQETETPILLMSVATNWKWRGRRDLPDDWLVELLGEEVAAPESYARALDLLDRRLAERAGDAERAEWTFQRAVAAERLGRFDEAREGYRAAMNADPHLRRALDAQADRVREVALGRGVGFLDVIDLLSRRSPHGIVGFESFYDYVHFTPRGAVIVAAAIFRHLEQTGLVAGAGPFDPEDYVREQEARLLALEEDPLDVGEWLGFGFDPGLIADRNLWKYDLFVHELDRRLQADPKDLRALVYRGNASSFRMDGAAEAARDYRAALAIAPDDAAIRANLERLLAERAR